MAALIGYVGRLKDFWTWKSGQDGQGTSLASKVSLMVALCIPVILETLDYTVVATAQSHIASVFHALHLQSYIGTAYLLSSTVFIPFFGSLSDIYGRHPALQLSLLFFMVVRIILADSRSLDENNFQTTALMILYAIGYCIGPVIGGALLSVYFRWIFAINLPACAAAIIICFLLLRKIAHKGKSSEHLPLQEGKKERRFDKLLRVDWIGTLLFIGGGIPLLLALNWGSTEAWNSAKVIASFVGGGILPIVCGCYELLLAHYRDSSVPPPLRVLWADPFIPMKIFLSYDVCAVLYSNFVQGMVMMVIFYFVAIFMVIVAGKSATNAGVQLIYFAPGMGAGSMVSMQIIKFTREPRRAVQLGSMVMTIGLGLISIGVDDNKQKPVDGFMVMTGAGVSLCVASSVLHVRFSQPEKMQARITAFTLFSLVAGIDALVRRNLMNAKVSAHITSAINSGAFSDVDVGSWSSSGLSSLQGIDALPEDVQSIVRTAFTIGTRYSFISLVPWAGLAFVTAMFLRHVPNLGRQEGKGSPDEESPGAGEMQEVEDRQRVGEVE
ncbi:MFS general substrate transporter [Neolentinus lepideus HHB14362 ss-1]|uniref:MFS general substrate transporter n=1 Tax=Neolentinus lepideus HHB14362 ss-1 TaxID=1314782 RepID=A0A165PHS3_9AGAM|nr:MFS general substrate transporter [Neolentinus lepideus HHB14362 ss-1]